MTRSFFWLVLTMVNSVISIKLIFCQKSWRIAYCRLLVNQSFYIIFKHVLYRCTIHKWIKFTLSVEVYRTSVIFSMFGHKRCWCWLFYISVPHLLWGKVNIVYELLFEDTHEYTSKESCIGMRKTFIFNSHNAKYMFLFSIVDDTASGVMHTTSWNFINIFSRRFY